MMKSSSIESTPPPGHSQSANEPPSPPRQSDEAISAVPAATPVEKGRFVLDLHNRDEDSDNDNASDNDKNSNNADNNKEEAQDDINTNNTNAPDSPKSFNSEELFQDIETGEQTNDADLALLLEGPLPLRRTTGGKLNNMELDSAEDDDPEESPHHRNRKRSKGLCGCCPNVVRRSTLCHLVGLGSVTNNRRDNAIIPPVKVGNMFVINSDCYYSRGFGIMGPHWFGPIACTILLSIATAHFAPKAFQNIGPLSGITCLLFYITALVSLLIVSCSDPGVVKPDCGRGDTNNGYAGLPTSDNVNARVGWRYCDLCSVYQPPGAVHCPECNVCIEGYDHHCPWMGTCIGKKNFTSFMAFNLTWLFYFFYAIIWVTFMGSALAAGPVESSAD